MAEDKQSLIRSLISQYIVSVDVSDIELEASSKSLAEYLQSGEISLLEFIKLLGPHLTDDGDKLRSSSVSCLVDTLRLVSPLKRNDLSVLTDFLLSKLTDEPCTLEALRGLTILVGKPGFQFAQVANILNSVRDHYDSKKHLAKVRYWSFELLKAILTKFEDQLIVALNDEFIDSFLYISANEKDPRNLILSFGLNTHISSKFDIETKSADLFDAAFCYFPISFKPPANDPYKITPEQLKEALRSVIAANSAFAKDALPSLIEKLSSTAPSVKLDTLETINRCVLSYDEATIEEYWLSVWNSLKFEILHAEVASVNSMDDLIQYYTNAENEEEKVIPLVLTVFKSLGGRFSGQNEAGLRDYISVVVNELGKFLTTPDHKQAKQSAIILSAIASANVHVFNLVISTSFPFLLQALEDDASPWTISKQRSMITNVSFVLDSYDSLFTKQSNVIDPETNALFQYKSEILMLLTRSLGASLKVEVSLRCLAIKTIGKIVNLKSLLNLEEGKLLVQSLTEVLLEDDNPNTFGVAVGGLKEVARIRPSLIVEVTLPQLLALLPDEETTKFQASSNKCIDNETKVLQVIAEISENKEILDVVMIRILSKMSVLLKSSTSVSDVRAILKALETILKKSEAFPGMSTNDYLRKFIPQFLYLVLDGIFINSSSPIYHDNISLEIAGTVVKVIITGSDLTLHQKVLDEFMDLLVLKKGFSLLSKPLSSPIDVFAKGNESAAPLLSKVFAATDKATTLPLTTTDLSDRVISALETETDIFTRQCYLQILSLVINKWFDSNDDDYLRLKCTSFMSTISGSEDLAQRSKHLELLVWSTKALVMKNDKYAHEILEYLVSLLEVPELANVAPKAFEILVADVECFDAYKKAGATSKALPFAKKAAVFNISTSPLYKQRFFNTLIPKLIAGSNRGGDQKRTFLITLSLIAKYADKAIIVPHLEEITPLLLQSLEIPNDKIRSSSLVILEIAIAEYPALIKKQLQTLIPRLLDLAQPDTHTGEEVKINTLKCLLGLTINEKIGFVALMPYKTGVIRNLLPTLDDKRRSVRKMASDCRQQYYELAQGSES
ncbi:unnamed protein product [Kuraishia capsulata CBS 1993]|uniref:MMS19 nucleotide excision repair protein n=1 Tax=Kuraishia capsulata CBS 1993 TaxID=1382522 RepID=W6MJ29_9ASCO|nr:uncharacterized protein KUCA_T00002192001 [Kuraishia capsulata CBS 1993]CDK26221.1 unnamed protein product [Kuraishia capsulata CBS 1993]